MNQPTNHENEPQPFFTADRIVTVNVDVQNDFLPGGALAVTDGDEVIAPLNELDRFTRANGGTVVFTGDQHPAYTPHFIKWPPHCIEGTPGAGFHKSLDVQNGDTIIAKGRGQEDGYSGFEGETRDGQTLEQIVTPRGRERVALLIGGLATDYCVLNTVRDATDLAQTHSGLEVFAIRDAMRAVNLEATDGDMAIREMVYRGATVIESVDILTGQAFALAQENRHA